MRRPVVKCCGEIDGEMCRSTIRIIGGDFSTDVRTAAIHGMMADRGWTEDAIGNAWCPVCLPRGKIVEATAVGCIALSAIAVTSE